MHPYITNKDPLYTFFSKTGEKVLDVYANCLNGATQAAKSLIGDVTDYTIRNNGISYQIMGKILDDTPIYSRNY